MSTESEQKSRPIPFYTKAGGGIALIVMLIIATMIAKNFMTAVKYGSQTEKTAVDLYYQTGFKDGQTDNEFLLPTNMRNNPVIRKAYNKGYREGTDTRQSSQQ